MEATPTSVFASYPFAGNLVCVLEDASLENTFANSLVTVEEIDSKIRSAISDGNYTLEFDQTKIATDRTTDIFQNEVT